MNYAEGKLVSLTPCAPGWHAVYAGEQGEPELEPVACWALYQHQGEAQVIALTRSSCSDARLLPADIDAMFVGIATPGEGAFQWEDACRDHFEAMGGELDDDPSESGDDPPMFDERAEPLRS